MHENWDIRTCLFTRHPVVNRESWLEYTVKDYRKTWPATLHHRLSLDATVCWESTVHQQGVISNGFLTIGLKKSQWGQSWQLIIGPTRWQKSFSAKLKARGGKKPSEEGKGKPALWASAGGQWDTAILETAIFPQGKEYCFFVYPESSIEPLLILWQPPGVTPHSLGAPALYSDIEPPGQPHVQWWWFSLQDRSQPCSLCLGVTPITWKRTLSIPWKFLGTTVLHNLTNLNKAQ